MTLETTRISLIHQETGVLMNLMATGFSLSGHSSCGCKKRTGWNIAMCDSRAARPSGPRLESSERASESLIVEIDQKLFFCIPGHWHWDLRMIKIKKKKKEQRDEEPSCWLYHPTIVNIIKYTVPLTSQLHSLPNLVIPEALRPMTCLWKRNSFSMSHLSRENRRFRCRPWAENPDFRIENDRIHGNFTAMFHHGDSLFQKNLSEHGFPILTDDLLKMMSFGFGEKSMGRFAKLYHVSSSTPSGKYKKH